MSAGPHPFTFVLPADLTSPTAGVVLCGDLDFSATPSLTELLTLVLGKQPRDIVLYMDAVTFLDCAAAQAIAAAAQALPGPGRLTIHRPGPLVRRLLHLTGLDTVIAIGEPAIPPVVPRVPPADAMPSALGEAH
jgi:anti-anti-sigma factor